MIGSTISCYLYHQIAQCAREQFQASNYGLTHVSDHHEEKKIILWCTVTAMIIGLAAVIFRGCAEVGRSICLGKRICMINPLSEEYRPVIEKPDAKKLEALISCGKMVTIALEIACLITIIWFINNLLGIESPLDYVARENERAWSTCNSTCTLPSGCKVYPCLQ